VAGYLALLASLVLCACVTESVKPVSGRSKGIAVRPNASTAAQLASQTAASGPAPAVPDAPIASPANEATFATNVEVGVVPLGAISYDGSAMPLVSPDGRFIAAEEDEAPGWEAILAQNGAKPPLRTRLALYQTGDRTLTRLPLDQSLPPGLILGRAADDKGFLVEAPQHDGSRWIGRIAWVGGSVEWLVQGPVVAAHATLTSRGELLYITRPLDSEASDLVIRAANGAQSIRTADPGWYCYPMCTQDPDIIYALHLGADGTALEAIKLDRGPDLAAARPPQFGAVIARRSVSATVELSLARQIAISSPQPIPQQSPVKTARLAFFNPARRCMSEFRLDTASFEPLAPNSQAAVPSSDPSRPGYYCTTQTGLVFTPTNVAPGPEGIPTIRVLSSPYIARTLRLSPESMMLFGPQKDHTDQLEVVKLVIAPPQAPARN
jgi:hypothetical protein